MTKSSQLLPVVGPTELFIQKSQTHRSHTDLSDMYIYLLIIPLPPEFGHAMHSSGPLAKVDEENVSNVPSIFVSLSQAPSAKVRAKHQKCLKRLYLLNKHPYSALFAPSRKGLIRT